MAGAKRKPASLGAGLVLGGITPERATRFTGGSDSGRESGREGGFLWQASPSLETHSSETTPYGASCYL